jgi:8-oxo-dGTP pyrophosphatase MutT (NUDIX family)
MAEDEVSALFSGMATTIKRLAAGEQRAVEPRHAATVILLRDGDTGLEVYLLRRSASMSFAPGAFVFPGGSTDPRDETFDGSAWVGPPPSEWAQQLRCDEPIARALVCAAVRETFEESGVLLAGTDAGPVVSDTGSADWEVDRAALLDRSLSLAEMMRRRLLVLRSDLLRFWAHWITPEVESRRFDTRFFVAGMPPGQHTRDVGGESDRVLWTRPELALEAQRQRQMSLMPPTQSALRNLGEFETVADVMVAAEKREVEAVLPKVILDANERIRFLLPDDPDYPRDPHHPREEAQ